MYKHMLLFNTSEEANKAVKDVNALFPLSWQTVSISNDGSSRDITLSFLTSILAPLSVITRLRARTSPKAVEFNIVVLDEGEEMLEENIPSVKPEYGMGATLCLPNDRYPFTVVAVENDNRSEAVLIAIQRDQEEYIGTRGGYLFHCKPESQDIRFVRRKKNGEWRTKSGFLVVIGSRSYYRAPEF